MPALSDPCRRKPPRTSYRGRPLWGLCDERLRCLSSPRRRSSQALRTAFRVEMGWRFVFGSSPEELSQREEDREQFEETFA